MDSILANLETTEFHVTKSAHVEEKLDYNVKIEDPYSLFSTEHPEMKIGSKDYGRKTRCQVEYLYFRGRYAECIKIAEHYLQENNIKQQRVKEQFYETIARSYFKLNELNKARFYANELIKMYPKTSKHQFLLGKIDQKLDMKVSISHFISAIENNPRDVYAWMELGKTCLEVQIPKWATKCFQKTKDHLQMLKSHENGRYLSHYSEMMQDVEDHLKMAHEMNESLEDISEYAERFEKILKMDANGMQLEVVDPSTL